MSDKDQPYDLTSIADEWRADEASYYAALGVPKGFVDGHQIAVPDAETLRPYTKADAKTTTAWHEKTLQVHDSFCVEVDASMSTETLLAISADLAERARSITGRFKIPEDFLLATWGVTRGFNMPRMPRAASGSSGIMRDTLAEVFHHMNRDHLLAPRVPSPLLAGFGLAKEHPAADVVLAPTRRAVASGEMSFDLSHALTPEGVDRVNYLIAALQAWARGGCRMEDRRALGAALREVKLKLETGCPETVQGARHTCFVCVHDDLRHGTGRDSRTDPARYIRFSAFATAPSLGEARAVLARRLLAEPLKEVIYL